VRIRRKNYGYNEKVDNQSRACILVYLARYNFLMAFDVLDGGEGDDQLYGGQGNDIYYITWDNTTCVDSGGFDTYVIYWK